MARKGERKVGDRVVQGPKPDERQQVIFRAEMARLAKLALGVGR